MNLDPASVAARYLPGKGVTTRIDFTGTSSVWTVINSTPAPRWFALSCSQDCYVVSGPSVVAAAATTDFRLPAGIHDFIINPGEGVRVISAGVDGVLTIAPAGV